MDTEQLARELVRAVRGRRAQAAFSKRLGCTSNVLYTWESGRRFPSAHRFLEVCARAGIDVPAAFGVFFRTKPAWLGSRSSALPESIVTDFLAELRGGRSLIEIARAMNKSRFRVARWFAGETEPRLPDFLQLVHVTSYRLLDFVAALVPPDRVPSVAASFRELEAARRAAYELPWSHAVLRLLETVRYARRGEVRATDLASDLGLSVSQVTQSLAALETSGQLAKEGGSWRVTQVGNVDLGEDAKAVRGLKAWAARVGLERIERGADGTYSYNLFCVSRRDYEKLSRMHRAYFRQVRAIVAESRPSEQVVMLNLQLFPLTSG